MNCCTTVEGIEDYTRDLQGLRRLAKDRAAAYQNGWRLSEFVVHGRLFLDAIGNVRDCKFEWDSRPFEGFAESLKPVVPLEHLQALGRLTTSVFFTQTIPTPEAVCPECGYGWSIKDWFDSVRHTNPDSNETTYSHSLCATLARDRRHLKFYADCAAEAGLGDMILSPTPSEYYAEDAPWVVMRTPKGNIKFGWRKRVINIDWSHVVEHLCAPYKSFFSEEAQTMKRAIGKQLDGHVLFAKEDVTIDSTHVHAWGKDKLVEYLEILSKEMGIGKYRPKNGNASPSL